jgi:hypothetical protein
MSCERLAFAERGSVTTDRTSVAIKMSKGITDTYAAAERYISYLLVKK